MSNIPDKIMCVKHGSNPISISNFYVAGEMSVFAGLGYIPICKRCIYKMMEEYYRDKKDMKESMYCVCRKLDIAFDTNIFEGSLTNDKQTATRVFQGYITQYNSLGARNGTMLVFDQGEHVGGVQVEEKRMNIIEGDVDKFTTTKTMGELTATWGSGFTNEEYTFLEMEYEEWTTRHKCDEYSEEVLYKEICLQILDIRKERANQRDVSKKVDSLQKLMTSANVKPADASALKSAENVNALGLWTRDIEKYRPAEYFDKKSKYADHDGFKDYIDRMMLRPLKNLLTGSRDFDNEFSIDGQSDADE